MSSEAAAPVRRAATAGDRPDTRRGRLFIVSAPSGTGKTTVVERMIEQLPGIRRSRSYTSRPMRPGEADGVDYNFIARDEFERRIAAHEFLEWANVFGNLYGTAEGDTKAALETGIDLVLVIDVQGAAQVRRSRLGRRATGVFILPPSFQVLEERLRLRSKDPEDQIRRRLQTAREEVKEWRLYDYLIVNDDLDGAVRRLSAIVTAERCTLRRMDDDAERILATFQ